MAAQCQELEDAMISEVMAFYRAFNRKLDEIRKRHLRDDSLDDNSKGADVLEIQEPEEKIKL